MSDLNFMKWHYLPQLKPEIIFSNTKRLSEPTDVCIEEDFFFKASSEATALYVLYLYTVQNLVGKIFQEEAIEEVSPEMKKVFKNIIPRLLYFGSIRSGETIQALETSDVDAFEKLSERVRFLLFLSSKEVAEQSRSFVASKHVIRDEYLTEWNLNAHCYRYASRNLVLFFDNFSFPGQNKNYLFPESWKK